MSRIKPDRISISAAPERLPAGRHRIPEEEIRRNQRRRLLAAITALSCERGYANIVISDITARARVSKSTFYRFFRTKEDCLFDSHKRHSAALIATIDRSCRAQPSPPAERLRAGLGAALAHLRADRQAAHLLTLGILSSGPRGAERHRVLLDALSARAAGGAADGGSLESARTAVRFAAAALASPIPAEDRSASAPLEAEFIELFVDLAQRGAAQVVG